MDKKMKLIAIILAVISLGAALIAFSYMGRYNFLMRDFQELQKEKQTLRAENDALASKTTRVEEELSGEKLTFDLEIQKLSKEKTDLQRQLEYNEKLSDSISLQLVREKEDKRKIQKQASLMKEENYALRIRLKSMMSAAVSLSF